MTIHIDTPGQTAHDDTGRTDRVILDSVETAIANIAAGKAVIVVDNEDRENEGDIIFAAEKATPELVAFMVRYSSGYICAPLTGKDCDRLGLSPMVTHNQDIRGTAYTVTVDANTGSTGISATSRAYTIQKLSDIASTPDDFTRPGHVVPLRAVPGGVLERPGHTEAAIDLARLAGLRPAGVLCEVVSEDNPTEMARGPELRRFADKHGLALISIDQMIEWRTKHDPATTSADPLHSRERVASAAIAERVTSTRLPTDFGFFTAVGYRALSDGIEHVALVVGDITDNDGTDVLVRVHSECLTGDVFGSRRCDCGQQLQASMKLVQEKGRGVILYLRGQEGRGIGLAEKLRAYHLQDGGIDTVDANLALGLPADARDYGIAAFILHDLGVRSANLLSNNPSKHEGLTGYGLEVSGRTPVEVAVNEDNLRYLITKRDRMRHDLPWIETYVSSHH
ncbi:3,4-dihydroxy-2-butanone 4-phosphate synthase [Corynebacterium pseudotuberculosis]|uniref:bifunctional 3,4-dihydroxy-2-butanone-4-phosphate synthase/GTP cyclohydrolase II n=1 Tax=Corynebacterium pseudotuberculosis TaxID=1719 RepID=UPI000737CB90|nr:bifunctional 3,4-dihydroxy-2-butanone-4-phosphate synthase/GTP cyclohydrolase II [Corynebacterium pseudotuberculosis]ALU21555.1 3,4-dihydroxy-2-butanone 4-phosphate synthase [Corynebacterium pseudotuberculosis]ANH23824.1 Riboflavin biosynthesis protein ribBA [Corynebacterium pseudotuberculosis]